MSSRHFPNLRQYIEWFCKNSDGKWKVIQPPNVPLAAWILLTGISLVIPQGSMQSGVHVLRDAVLFTWSYMEVTAGESKFRRVLGAVVMIFLLRTFFSI